MNSIFGKEMLFFLFLCWMLFLVTMLYLCYFYVISVKMKGNMDVFV